MNHISNNIEEFIVERRIKLPEIQDVDDSIDYDYFKISDVNINSTMGEIENRFTGQNKLYNKK